MTKYMEMCYGAFLFFYWIFFCAVSENSSFFGVIRLLLFLCFFFLFPTAARIIILFCVYSVQTRVFPIVLLIFIVNIAREQVNEYLLYDNTLTGKIIFCVILRLFLFFCIKTTI